MRSLSLYDLHTSIGELLEAREQLRQQVDQAEAAADVANTADLLERRAELVEVERLLAEYLTMEPAKVDGYWHYLRTAKVLQETMKEEHAAFAARRKRVAAAVEYLERKALEAMQATGAQRLDGTNGRYLLRQRNGGKAPLVVDSWDDEQEKFIARPVLPPVFQTITVTMSLDVYDAAVMTLTPVSPRLAESLNDAKVLAIAPNNGRIRATLDTVCGDCNGCGQDLSKAIGVTCDQCNGAGAFGAQAPDTNDVACAKCNGVGVLPPVCGSCAGTGKLLVPGARYGERGETIRVK